MKPTNQPTVLNSRQCHKQTSGRGWRGCEYAWKEREIRQPFYFAPPSGDKKRCNRSSAVSSHAGPRPKPLRTLSIPSLSGYRGGEHCNYEFARRPRNDTNQRQIPVRWLSAPFGNAIGAFWYGEIVGLARWPATDQPVEQRWPSDRAFRGYSSWKVRYPGHLAWASSYQPRCNQSLEWDGTSISRKTRRRCNVQKIASRSECTLQSGVASQRCQILQESWFGKSHAGDDKTKRSGQLFLQAGPNSATIKPREVFPCLTLSRILTGFVFFNINQSTFDSEVRVL